MKDSGLTPETGAQEAKPPVTGKEKFRAAMRKANMIIDFTGSVLFRLRKLVMAAPVVYFALRLAAYNREHLPLEVGIDLQSTGEFARMISRDLAVLGPLGLTAACLLLMFCSRKALYPWAVSVFTLVLPLLVLITNLYPA